MIGREAAVDQLPHGELLEGQVEQHGVFLEEVETGAGDLAAGLEVDQVERLADLDVILGREVECLGADLADLASCSSSVWPMGASGWVRLGMRASR